MTERSILSVIHISFATQKWYFQSSHWPVSTVTPPNSVLLSTPQLHSDIASVLPDSPDHLRTWHSSKWKSLTWFMHGKSLKGTIFICTENILDVEILKSLNCKHTRDHSQPAVVTATENLWIAKQFCPWITVYAQSTALLHIQISSFKKKKDKTYFFPNPGLSNWNNGRRKTRK